MREEVRRHKDKLIKLAGFSESGFETVRDYIFSPIRFISEEQIPYDIWHAVLPIVLDDIAFVALAEYLDAYLWSGDKKLLECNQQIFCTNAGFTF